MRDKYPGRTLVDLYDMGGDALRGHAGGQHAKKSTKACFENEFRDVVEGAQLATLSFVRRLPIHHAHAQAALAAAAGVGVVCIGRMSMACMCRLYGSQLCVSQLCVSQLCVSQLCVHC